MIAIGYAASLLYAALCILIAALAYKLGAEKRITRKIVHILVGFEWVVLYHTVGVGIHFLAVCIAFTLLLLLSYKKNLFTMMSSDSDNAPGTVYYGVSMSVMALASLFIEDFVFAFGIAVFCTSFGDGLAGVVGAAVKRGNPKIFGNKTLLGTLAAFVFSLLSVYGVSIAYGLGVKLLHAICIAAFAAGIELICAYGLDNIFLPLGTSALSYFLLTVSGTEGYLLPIVLTPFVVALVLKLEILSKRAVAAALLLDLLVSVSLGNFGFVLFLSFLMLSAVVDKLKKHASSAKSLSEKREKRSEWQVFANGLIPALMATAYFFTGSYAFVIAFIASLAECFADTVASGLGAFSRTSFDPFRMKRVPVGSSGGMSLIGTLSSLAAAFLFVSIALLFGKIGLGGLLLCSLVAFFGAIFDSLLGSLLQAKYQCRVCGALIEKKTHCDTEAELKSGYPPITNSTVNFISVIFSAVLAVTIYFVFK